MDKPNLMDEWFHHYLSIHLVWGRLVAVLLNNLNQGERDRIQYLMVAPFCQIKNTALLKMRWNFLI